MAELGPPTEEIVPAHFIVSGDVERSSAFLHRVPGGGVIFSGHGEQTYVAPSNAVP